MFLRLGMDIGQWSHVFIIHFYTIICDLYFPWLIGVCFPFVVHVKVVEVYNDDLLSFPHHV